MTIINPCAFIDSPHPINLSRLILASVMLSRVTLILLLRVITMTCQSSTRVETTQQSVSRKKNATNIQEMAENPTIAEDTQIALRTRSHAIVKGGTKQQNGMPSDISYLKLGSLTLTVSQTSAFLRSGVAFQLIAESMVYMYFPFMHASLISAIHLIIFVISILVQAVGRSSTILSVLTSLLNGCTFFVGFYGLTTRIADSSGSACYDLSL